MSSENENDAASESPEDVSAAIKRIDVMYDQLVELTALFKEAAKANGGSHTQTVIHKTQGMGVAVIILTAICAALSAFCALFVVVEFNRHDTSEIEYKSKVDGQLRDVAAWQGVFGRDLTAIKTKVDQKEDNHVGRDNR